MDFDREKTSQEPATHPMGMWICWANRAICVLGLVMIPVVFFDPATLSWAHLIWQYTAFVLAVYVLVLLSEVGLSKAGKQLPPWL